MLTPFVVAGLTILGSVIAASMSFYFSRKRQIEDEQRNMKAEVYSAFYDAMIDLGCNPSNPGSIKAFSKTYNKLLFTGSDEVIAAIISWKAETDAKGGRSEFNSPLLKKKKNYFPSKKSKSTKANTITNLLIIKLAI